MLLERTLDNDVSSASSFFVNPSCALLGDETTTVFTANEIAYDVTTVLTTNATTIHMDRAPGAANKKANAPRATTELILKASTTYVIRFTAVGNSNSGFIRLSWYEHTANII